MGKKDDMNHNDTPGNAGASPAPGNATFQVAKQDECGQDARDPRGPGSNQGGQDARDPEDARDTNGHVAECESEWHFRGYLPHFDRANTLQGLTFRLHDSIPADVIERWKQELGYRENATADSQEAIRLRHRLETYANAGHGACYLRNPRIAEIVQNALLHFNGERYLLYAWCIMPNHVHILLETCCGQKLRSIVHSWKSFTANQANKLLQRKGDFWMPDYFYRRIRNAEHYAVALAYIHNNPVKAGLVQTPEEWPWSSAGGSIGNAGAPGNATFQVAKCGQDARDPT